MSQKPINLSPDLKRLRDEGYDLEIRSGFLLVKDVPYVNAGKEVKRGILVCKLDLAGDVTVRPDTHVAYLIGEYPCHSDGNPIEEIRNQSATQMLAERVVIQHTFSAKPKPSDSYADYYDKVTTYVAILSGPAHRIKPEATAKTFPIIEPDDDDSPFHYIDTASSRAEITVITDKLKHIGRIAIVGLGGTGSYILDLVAKTPVKQIHLYDGDTYLQHNAFRSPGAPSVDELRTKLPKSTYLKSIYSKMHKGLVDHPVPVDAANVDELRDMDFVFVCLDNGESKKLIVEHLELFGRPFIDVGMGLYLAGDSLGGIVRTTTSTPEQRDHFRKYVSFGSGGGNNEYNRNIQIAELNALNAALAVIRWKKLAGFFVDEKHEHHSTYTIDGNQLTSDERRP